MNHLKMLGVLGRYGTRLGALKLARCISATSQPTPDPRMSETIRDYLDPSEFISALQKRNIDFFTGVPDSLLKIFCSYLLDNVDKSNNIIAANEGNALSIATGYHLSTGKYPCVYMQNSGLGNIINPLLSLAHQGVYSIPMLLMIGWRGEPGKKDEPQHMIQGERTGPLLTAAGTNFEVLPDYIEGAEQAIESAINYMKNRGGPYAFIVRRQTFAEYKQQRKFTNDYPLSREDCINAIVENAGEYDPIISTTGFASRELYELQKREKKSVRNCFLCVGSMGHASSIALGIALQKKSRKVICLDGDGAAIMHMGSLAVIGGKGVKNIIHIILNNNVHESVGGQPTVGGKISFTEIGKSCGYKQTFEVKTKEEIANALKQCTVSNGPSLLEVKCHTKTRGNLSRPKETPKMNKEEFMDFLSE